MTLFHSDFLEAKLLESIRKESVQSTNTEFELIEYNASGLIIGGLVASVSYGWLLIKILWVDKEYRKTGIGRKLMLNAEKKVIQIGCHSVWLDTSNPKAKAFYSSRGYTAFGELKNTSTQLPLNHCRWFMKNVLCRLVERVL